MSTERDPGFYDDDATLTVRLADWVEGARENENFTIGGGIWLGILMIPMLILHTSTYAATVHHPVAFGGALVGLIVSILAATVATASFRTWPRGRWRALAAAALLAAAIFALLPPITAGYGWLTTFLFAITTIGYEAAVAAWLVIARPWAWIGGLPV